QRPAQQPIPQQGNQTAANDDLEDLPPANLANDNNPYSSTPYDTGDIPPADIGDPGPTTATVRPHRTSLLDVILGQ
ncbi:MAG TPA: hypothetical protein VGC14_22965, partial [Rhizobium sp.]